ncbi:MAG: tRNA (guanosine(37)-N1)-methyltransferase TrmD [Actinobacteria bacterium]|nr:tRNA (guanosine(37)-N1)-methyltransferase TrmD [Actinomycetota bacterium]
MLDSLRILTIFPEMFDQFQEFGVVGKAIRTKKIQFSVHDLRDFGVGKHKDVDDSPYGGGPGMVMRPEPFYDLIESLKYSYDEVPYVVLTSPRGKLLNQKMIENLSEKKCIYLLCGRYEGVDQRVSDLLVDEELSLGNYILSGGEVPAMVISDCLIRQIPGTLGSSASLKSESFSDQLNGKKKEPVYTKPRQFLGQEIPKILLSGNHEKISKWRNEMQK